MPAARFAGAVALFIVGGLSQYLGAAVAVGAFDVMSALVVSWWRIALAALVMLAWRRPWRIADRSWWLGAAIFGVVLGAMNASFYLAIERIPLGTAVAIEFVGPVAVAALTGRGWNTRLGIAAAGAGVVVIGGLGVDWDNAGTGLGLLFALLAGACWAGYILVGARLVQRVNGIDGLSVAMAVGAVALLPIAFMTPAAAIADPWFMATLLAVAVLSSVVPYVVDQLYFGVLPRATFAILLALLPATSVLVGAIVLRQIPNGWEILGLGLVSVAVMLANLKPSRT